MKKDNNLNALERLLNYKMYSKYLTEQNNNTISELSNRLEIPITIVHSDFETLTLSGVLPIDFKDIEDTKENLAKQIHSGELDNIPFYIFDDNSDNISISVTQDEYLAYHALLAKQDIETSTFYYKKHAYAFDCQLLKYLDEIEQAIDGDLYIEFPYQCATGKGNETKCVKPVRIGFDATESRYVLVCASKDGSASVYELDYIQGPIKTVSSNKIQNKYQINPYILDCADKVWGFEFDKCLDSYGKKKKPLRVKLQFYNHGNVINKVRRDLSFRNPIQLKETSDDGLIYEDDVFGIDSFLNWIFSFGSSVKILSPDSLVKELITRLNNYPPNDQPSNTDGVS